ncbi:MAG: DNA/RNA non-specific endonuclease [Alistipes sp.]|nr:DNA/RNA non-specific endonuclease [Alistipes sp.]
MELPAERKDGAYPNAVEVKVSSGGERNYTHYYDTATYTSLWTAYPLSSKHMGSLSRPGSWSYNPSLSTSVQVNLCSSSYNDNYSRGHLIPNASRNGIKEMQTQTFYVTNSVPQIQDNFNGGIWQTLEAALQSEAKSETIYIVTGVAFAKEGETKTIKYTTAKDDTKRVPVPNYFYKVVLKVKTNSSGVVTSASTVGFWFEHKTYSTTTFENYAVSVDQIEEWTGFDFFPNLPDTVEASAEQNSLWTTFQNF